MKNRLVIIVLFFPFIILGQSIDSLKLKIHVIGFNVSPDYCYRLLKSNSTSEWIKEGLDTLEVPKLGYTAGISYSLKLNKRITISTGVLLSNKGEKTKKVFSSKSSTFNYNNQFYYLDIPVKVSYNIYNKRFKFFITTGISGNVFLVEKTEQITGYTNDDVKNKFYNKNGFSKINMAIIAGFGCEFPLTNNWCFKIEPTYRRSITPISSAPIKKYLYSLGINFGLFKSF